MVEAVDPAVERESGDAYVSSRGGGTSLRERPLSLGLVVQFLIATVVVVDAVHVSELPGVEDSEFVLQGRVIWKESAVVIGLGVAESVVGCFFLAFRGCRLDK